MKGKFTLGLFLQKYSNDESCLAQVFKLKYPDGVFCDKCQKTTNFTKITNRFAYQCSCGYQIYPLAGTIFEKTTTPLQYWFYAMFLISNTRSGVSAKQLQRELGVTYKTAWRMFKQIRMLMAETGGGLLTGDVEIDETFVGGKGKNRKYVWSDGFEKPKEVLMGMLERGGKVYIKHIPNTGKYTLLNQIKENVDPKARIHTDEYSGYKNIHKYGYLNHQTINHGTHEYARGDVYTQNIENVWSHFKRGITGVYRIVSKKYLQAYADEYAFRYNRRKNQSQMFELLLAQVANVQSIN